MLLDKSDPEKREETYREKEQKFEQQGRVLDL